ncbi:MAG: ABC transporter substrate-binding protein, partial [Herbaspirillum sp.]
MRCPIEKPSRRRDLCLALAAFSAGLPLLPWRAVQAHGDDSTHAHEVAVVSPDVLTVVGPWEMTGLDPSLAGYLFTRMEVAETLLEVDDKGQLQPGLASSWQVSADGSEWRFTLHAGRRYHDDTPVTVSTVLACLRRAHSRPGVLRLAAIKSLAADGGDIVVSLNHPFGPLSYLFTHYSAQILAPSSFAADGSVVRIIGSGPFRISSLSLPQQFNVERCAGYREGVKGRSVQRARYISVARSETRMLLVQSGQADLAFSFDPPSIRVLQHSPKATLVSVMLPRTTFIKLNTGHPFLSDVRVRRAIALCVERQGIARALLRDPELGATQLFP